MIQKFIKKLIVLAITTGISFLLSTCKKDEPCSCSKPDADFTANQTIITAGESIAFTDQSKNSIKTWSWNFGDGGTSSLQHPSYTYTSSGIYTVSLTVTNNYDSDSITKINYITVYSGTVTDIDGNVYNTINIGSQDWMTANLNTKHYNDGAEIPNITEAGQWEGFSDGAYCYFDNYTGYDTIYGALYNWYAVNTGKICPVGWHVPSDSEWTTLTDYLGGENVAGGKLKSVTGWNDPNNGATNESGFTALPGGHRFLDGSFGCIHGFGYWWSSSDAESSGYIGCSFIRTLEYRYINAIRHNDIKNGGLSVRCLRD